MFSDCSVFGAGVSCSGWVIRFLSSPKFSSATVQAYKAALKAFLGWCQWAEVVCPDEQAIVRYRAWLLERYRLTTAQSYFAVVKVFFSWLGRYGLYEDVASGVKGVSVNRSVPLRDYLSGNDMMQVLSILKRKAESSSDATAVRDYVIVLLMVCCGLRVTEVTRLDVGDVISTSGGHQILVHGKGRDGKSDAVNVPDGVVDAIHRWLCVRSVKVKNFSKSSPLFASLGVRNYGGRLCSRTISQIVKRALVGAGFDSPRLTAHSLRHTAVTLALMAGASLQEAQQYARHRRIETTQIYAHNLEVQQNRCSRLVEKMVMGRIGEKAKRKMLGHCFRKSSKPRFLSWQAGHSPQP